MSLDRDLPQAPTVVGIHTYERVMDTRLHGHDDFPRDPAELTILGSNPYEGMQALILRIRSSKRDM